MPCWFDAVGNLLERLRQVPQFVDQPVRLGKRRLAEILHARPGIGEHIVKIIRGLLDRGDRLAQVLRGGRPSSVTRRLVLSESAAILFAASPAFLRRD